MPEPETHFIERLPRRNPRTVVALAVAFIAVLVIAAVTMGASPSPSAPDESGQLDAASQPVPSGQPAQTGRGAFHGLGRSGGHGLGAIRITAIDGSSLSLETDDGWTRTIDIDSTTSVTKGGEEIDPSELAVGDRIRLRQTRNDDGSFTVTAIDVVLPGAAGTVKAVTADTITIETRDGSTATINVDPDTTYRVGDLSDADLGDVAVGMRIIAIGTLNTDGSLDATAVRAGEGRLHEPGGHGKHVDPRPSASPKATASPG